MFVCVCVRVGWGKRGGGVKRKKRGKCEDKKGGGGEVKIPTEGVRLYLNSPLSLLKISHLLHSVAEYGNNFCVHMHLVGPR